MREYVIAGSYTEFMRWRKEDLEARKHVVYLTAERAEGFTERGVLHRVGSWRDSAALEGALRLEEPTRETAP